jgi:hypothetical protein
MTQMQMAGRARREPRDNGCFSTHTSIYVLLGAPAQYR